MPRPQNFRRDEDTEENFRIKFRGNFFGGFYCQLDRRGAIVIFD